MVQTTDTTDPAGAVAAAAATKKSAEGAATAKENVVNSSASAAGAPSNDGKQQLTVVRFLVQNLEGGRGHAATDYHVDLVQERHGLYDLVSTVFDILGQEKLTYDRITSHLWNVEFGGTTYRNGWRRRSPMEAVWDRPADATDVDEGERRVLSSLSVPLEKGQKGMFSGESARFSVTVAKFANKKVEEGSVVVKIADPWEIVDESKAGKGEGAASTAKMTFPKVAKVTLALSGKLESDWISSEDKARCLTLRSSWTTFFAGENSWKRNRRTGGWIPAKPQSPCWGGDEMKIIGLLLNANCKFKQSWNNILQYAFANRAESATSMKWYALKGKDYYRIEREGRGLTNEGKIRLAKRLAKKNAANLLDVGAPRKDPHPNARLESQLRKRGIIDEDTDASERKRLCAEYRGVF